MAQPAGTEVELSLKSGMHFEAVADEGIAVQLDSSPEYGGVGAGAQPLQLLLAGLGGCTAMDVISILRKKRQVVTRYRVQVSAVQANEYPRVFTSISLRHILEGNGLSEEAVRRAIELSENKYCPAFAMLERAAPISSSYEIHPAGPAD